MYKHTENLRQANVRAQEIGLQLHQANSQLQQARENITNIQGEVYRIIIKHVYPIHFLYACFCVFFLAHVCGIWLYCANADISHIYTHCQAQLLVFKGILRMSGTG